MKIQPLALVSWLHTEHSVWIPFIISCVQHQLRCPHARTYAHPYKLCIRARHFSNRGSLINGTWWHKVTTCKRCQIQLPLLLAHHSSWQLSLREHRSSTSKQSLGREESFMVGFMPRISKLCADNQHFNKLAVQCTSGSKRHHRKRTTNATHVKTANGSEWTRSCMHAWQSTKRTYQWQCLTTKM